MLYNINEINHQADTDKWTEPDWTGRCCQSKRNQVFRSTNRQRPSPAHCSVESCRVFSPGTKSQHLSNKWSHWSKQTKSSASSLEAWMLSYNRKYTPEMLQECMRRKWLQFPCHKDPILTWILLVLSNFGLIVIQWNVNTIVHKVIMSSNVGPCKWNPLTSSKHQFQNLGFKRGILKLLCLWMFIKPHKNN